MGNYRINFLPLALSLPAMALVSGCEALSEKAQFFSAGSADEAEGLSRVDDLLGQVERVYVECELSKERGRDALTALRDLVSPDFDGEAQEAYLAFVEAIEHSERQAAGLRESVDPMKSTADAVFASWGKDLEGFSSAAMRRHSQLRLEQTRAMYDDVVRAVEPAQWVYEALNRSLRDHALFLANDLNTASVAAIEPDVVILSEQAVELDQRLEESLLAAEAYVRSAALRGQIDEPVEAPAPAPQPEERAIRDQ